LTLFVTPAAAEGAGQETWQGYNLVRWSQGGMRFLAVSDLERGELERFAAILRTRIAAK
jgi:anti-sigma factor RsiW